MEYFVHQQSVVRRIWGNTDTILFIFAGASAEFALNKAVDWLYFTGKLPADPIGRLFSTVTYARKIVFSSNADALRAIDTITSIHQQVEANRQSKIPQWAYRDVLFMLIHYSIAAFELLQRNLNADEKEEVYNVFLRVGQRMRLEELPSNYPEWLIVQKQHLQKDLVRSHFTNDLLLQYKKHLGSNRYRILIEAQKLVVPDQVSTLLQLKRVKWLLPSVPVYKLLRLISLDGFVKNILLPDEYKDQVLAMEHSSDEDV
ncbi:MAG: oxygenase MpaB family protein [Chitinophagales bacterium]